MIDSKAWVMESDGRPSEIYAEIDIVTEVFNGGEMQEFSPIRDFNYLTATGHLIKLPNYIAALNLATWSLG
jgi:hypothetical protein